MLTARPLSIWDTAFCWRLANEPSVRASSMDPTPPTLHGHLLWMARWLLNGDRQAWVLRTERLVWYGTLKPHEYREVTKLGLVRIHVDGTVSIAVLPKHRGKGVALYGVNVATYFAVLHGWDTPTAYIRADNGPSIGLFAKAGYEMAGASDGIVVMQRRAA